MAPASVSGRGDRMQTATIRLLLLFCLVLAAPSYSKVTEEMLRDTSTSVDIYSALHDPIQGYVRLFLEFFPIHPHEKAEDEPDPFPHEVFRGCVFSHHRNFSQSKEVPALEVHSMAQPGNQWIDCRMEEDYAFATVQTLSGHVHRQAVRIVTLHTERAGGVSACIAPLFSQRPDIHQWLHHYTQLGVNKFHMYVPTLHYHEAHFDAPYEVWKTVKGFNFRHGETHTDPFHPFDHPLAEWRYYSPSNRENYFGQVLMYNECMMRSRYSYDFVMFLDVDEFISINATILGQEAPVSLPAFLRQTFPKKTASLELVTYGYPRNCPASTSGSFVERHKIRDREVITHHVKVVVRPKAVREVFVHFVVAVEKGWHEKLRVREEAAFLKHLIWLPPAYANCRAYVYEDTGKSPGD